MEGKVERYHQGSGEKLWGGRFTGQLNPVMETFNKSITFDQRLWKADIEGSIAYAQGLRAADLLSKEEVDVTVNGLQKVYGEFYRSDFRFLASDEDIHTAVERRLTELIGPAGGKLHTGRSRNDQTATDLRIWLKTEIIGSARVLEELINVICYRAEKEIDILMPGYTHMQRAQPVRWSHYLMSHAARFLRDHSRLEHIRKEVDVLPLGSGALAGNPFDIDRQLLADNLNFAAVSANSMDAVSDRDFVASFLFWASLISVHLSQFAEDLILYSTKEFGFITISESFSTGSSLMPQKRNPDSLELLRGKSGRLLGNSTGFMTTLKGLPGTYNKDLQEDKEALFDSVDQIQIMLEIAIGVVTTLTVNPAACRAALSFDMLATDMAYYLVRKGVPFREAHHISGKIVSHAESKACPLSKLTLQDFQSVDHRFEPDILDIWDFETSVEQYKISGGTARVAVLEQIENVKRSLACLSAKT